MLTRKNNTKAGVSLLMRKLGKHVNFWDLICERIITLLHLALRAYQFNVTIKSYTPFEDDEKNSNMNSTANYSSGYNTNRKEIILLGNFEAMTELKINGK